MTILTIPKPLREKLGEEATDAFVFVINSIDLESKKDLVTKTDLLEAKNELDRKIDNVHSELNNKIDNIHSDLNSKIDNVHSELNSKIDNVHSELNSKIDKSTSELKSDIKLLHWMIGIIFAGVISLVMKAFF
ncbi:MAG: hypothetical protein HQK91_08250 [Nitrospirae bacterium]|nr:hypothetical protein [Nitrospirota bacterium]